MQEVEYMIMSTEGPLSMCCLTGDYEPLRIWGGSTGTMSLTEV